MKCVLLALAKRADTGTDLAGCLRFRDPPSCDPSVASKLALCLSWSSPVLASQPFLAVPGILQSLVPHRAESSAESASGIHHSSACCTSNAAAAMPADLLERAFTQMAYQKDQEARAVEARAQAAQARCRCALTGPGRACAAACRGDHPGHPEG